MQLSRVLAAAGVTMVLSAVTAPGPAAAAPASTPERSMTGAQLAGTAHGAIDARAAVILRNHSGKCLEIANSSKRNGARAQQWTCNGQAGAKWKLRSLGGGRAEIINARSGKCLEIENSSKRNGARAQQWTCNGQAGAKWRFAAAGGGRVYIINVRSGKCLEIENSSARNGARAQQWTCNGQAGSEWS
ncbi:RICIN domain-containing protein [Streptomyces sp. Go40/10]|uniref:RICIN domain-containing protein n=1 Tax=Streptomyces sp. Go40/10 TaxID=2825844 RepID=UPI001E5C67B4|nr:RICIN domain-containing protein [Streptomyces sp. Go40/10]UFR06905.1 RICIN domain-containing protein [Streptomyces sp. Go40/10]